MSAQIYITASAPMTIGNVGPGFDVLGLAIGGRRDCVTVSRADHDDIKILKIIGDGGALPTDTETNTAGVAARETRALAGCSDVGIDLVLHKGIPLESGVGSSAASAAAAACAVNQLLGGPLRREDLLGPCLEAEAVVSGRHADNVGAALLGGLVLVRDDASRVRLQRIPIPDGLIVVVVTPEVHLNTRESRAVLPEVIPLTARTHNAANIAALISACYSGDLGLLSGCVEDDVVTPARLPLIPGGREAIDAARQQGALAASISGAGPSLFAFTHAPNTAESIASAMVRAFEAVEVSAQATISPADCPGVRIEPTGATT